MKPITKRQQAILDFIKEEVDKRGYPPSVREIGLAVGLSSTASVHNQLNQTSLKQITDRWHIPLPWQNPDPGSLCL